jgi:hypothetical protein
MFATASIAIAFAPLPFLLLSASTLSSGFRGWLSCLN